MESQASKGGKAMKSCRETKRKSNTSCKCSNTKRKIPSRNRSERSGKTSSESVLPHTSDTDSNPSKSSSKTKRNVGIQTMKSFMSMKKGIKYCPNNDNSNIDETQPFVVMMSWNPPSRIPSKFIVSNINAEMLQSLFK